MLFTLHYPAGSFDLGDFKWTPFLAQFGVVAGYQISWAIYVSDYSRYLPPDVTVRKTFYWTYWGSALGGVWLMCLGALLAAWAGRGLRAPIARSTTAGDKFFTGFGAIVLIFVGARPDLGHRAEHVRRLAHPDQRASTRSAGSTDHAACGSVTDRHHRRCCR